MPFIPLACTCVYALRAFAGGGIDDVDGNYHIQRLTSRVASQFSIRAAISGNVNFSWHQVSVELPPNPKKNLPGKTIIDGSK